MSLPKPPKLPCEWRLGVTTSFSRITSASCFVFLKILGIGRGWGFRECPLCGIGLKGLGGLKVLGKLRVLTSLNFSLFGSCGNARASAFGGARIRTGGFESEHKPVSMWGIELFFKMLRERAKEVFGGKRTTPKGFS